MFFDWMIYDFNMFILLFLIVIALHKEITVLQNQFIDIKKLLKDLQNKN